MTFPREMMAGICLAIVGFNTLLIALDLLTWLRTLLRLRRHFSDATAAARLVRGHVEGALAEAPRLAIQLVGHGRGQGKIFFHARKPEAIVSPALAFVAQDRGESVRYRFDADGETWIWPDESAFRRAFACPDGRVFAELAPSTERAKGAEHAVDVVIDPSRPVYVYGSFDRDGRIVRSASIGAAHEQAPRLIIAGFDPRAWTQRQAGKIVATLLAIASSFSFLTWLCFQGEAFGLWSQIGAFGLFLFFLLVQPIGVALRENTAFPQEVPRHPIWRRPQVSSATSPDSTERAAQSFPANTP